MSRRVREFQEWETIAGFAIPTLSFEYDAEGEQELVRAVDNGDCVHPLHWVACLYCGVRGFAAV